MRFLRLLFVLFLLLLAGLFLGRNWTDVTVDLWCDMQADVKLPLLLLLVFLIGWLPTSALWRSRLWQTKREALSQRLATPPPPEPFEEDTRP